MSEISAIEAQWPLPLYLLLDEADHFISDFDGDDIEGIERQANVLKSIVQGTGTRLVLIGTYDVAPLVTLNGQLARRNRRVHMARYRNTPDDRTAFKGILRDIDEHFRGFFSFSLEKNDADIYEGCIGLIGVLRDWLALAATASIRDGEETISLETLFGEITPIGVLDTILDCAENGERNFYVTDAEVKDFKERVHKQTVAG